MRQDLDPENLFWARPSRPCGTGVLVLAGSSGRVDAERADLLAQHGATALAMRWFGGRGQPPVASEVPLETFVEALDLVAVECDHLAIIGLSYGAEAALLVAALDARVTTTVALSPTDVAWEGQRTSDADPTRSKWTWGGAPLPFVPMDHTWRPQEPAPWFLPYYETSRAAADDSTIAAATIPVERISGDVVLVAGGDDLVWPSAAAARAIAARRRSDGLSVTLVADDKAGHFVTFPGEHGAVQARPYLAGGDERSSRRLGEKAWAVITERLMLHED